MNGGMAPFRPCTLTRKYHHTTDVPPYNGWAVHRLSFASSPPLISQIMRHRRLISVLSAYKATPPCRRFRRYALKGSMQNTETSTKQKIDRLSALHNPPRGKRCKSACLPRSIPPFSPVLVYWHVVTRVVHLRRGE